MGSGFNILNVELKENFTLEQSTKSQRGRWGIAVLIL